MNQILRKVLTAGAAVAMLGAAACSTLEASTDYGDGAAVQSANGDIQQQMARDSQGA
ncbi:MAG TPA: hypothetical protein VEG27_03175 [Usitatibacter sp.]|nr:hypothetical protein [Usitatibacter sp.]